MQAGYIADRTLGYVKVAAAGIDAATLISTLTFGSSAVAGIPPGTHTLLISPELQIVRWRDDGVAVTTAAGYPIAVGGELRYTGQNLSKLQVISATAGAALNIVALGSGAP